MSDDCRAFEIDFLPVGDAGTSGDAITFRTGIYEGGQWKGQKVFVLDGGNLSSGAALVKHITEIYKTDSVERAILTHPDADHASGLRTVIKELKIGKIWMHRPWDHWKDLKDSVIDSRVTERSFANRLREAYNYAHEIEQLALQKTPAIPIYPPHQGNYYHIGDEKLISILGPGKEFYLSLVEESEKNPHLQGGSSGTPGFRSSASKRLVNEDMSFESENLLEDAGNTSPENNMSLILLLTVAGKKMLFTGDVGTMGLYKAIYYAVENNINLKDLDMFQVPHHGSRHNLSKGILENIKGEYGFISCAQNSDRHPSSIVTNALLRRGIKPYSTKGKGLCWHSENVPVRAGWQTASQIPFSNQVEVPIEE